MGLFDSVFKRHSELSWMYDLEFLQDKSKKAYLKQIAINTVAEMMGRIVAQSEFRTMSGDKIEKENLYYLLNVRPNKNQNAVDFWQKFIFKLIIDNEVLVVKNDDGYFFVADDFHYDDDLGLLPQKFTNVMVNNFEFKRVFSMDDVIYIKYNNDKFEKYAMGLFEDYGEIFGRMIDLQLKNNQVRSILNIDVTQMRGEDKQKQVQDYINAIFDSFSNNSVAVVPLTKGMEYEEHSSKGGSQNAQQFKELEELKRTILTDVARMVGLTPALVLGEMADLEKSIEASLKFGINPLLRKIESELNAKFYYPEEYLQQEKHIKVVGIDKRDPLELAEAIDKLRASGNYNGNQIRIMLGDEPVDDPKLDEYVMTKNYSSVQGGEQNDSGQI